MGKFHRQHAVGLEEHVHCGYKVVNVRHMGEYIDAAQQICPVAVFKQSCSQFCGKKVGDGGDSLGLRNSGRPCAGVNTQAGNAQFHRMLQQVTIVRAYFNNQRLVVEVKAFGCILNVAFGMGDP